MPIEVTTLCHSYNKGTPFERKVLHNISLTIDDGEFVGIIGPTQSGKTTLAQHINALFIPQSGKVVVNNCNTADKKADLVSLRYQVGYVFQNPDYQLFAPTVGKDIAFGLENQNMPEGDIQLRVKEVMALVGLDYKTFCQRDIFALSGGQKRRAAIAGVLACRPQILILDDITAGLDPQGREEILGVIRKLHHEEKITIIFITNNMTEVAELAERVVVINNGQIEMDGSTRDVFSQLEKLYSIGLELPEIMSIVDKLRSKGFELPLTVLNAEEAINSIAITFDQR